MIACDNMALYYSLFMSLCHVLEFILPVVLFVLPLLESQGRCCSRQAVLTAFQPICTVSLFLGGFITIFREIITIVIYCGIQIQQLLQDLWILDSFPSLRSDGLLIDAPQTVPSEPPPSVAWIGINFMASQNPQPVSVLGWVKNCPAIMKP